MLDGRPRNAAEAKARGMEARRLSPEEIAAAAATLGLPVSDPSGDVAHVAYLGTSAPAEQLRANSRTARPEPVSPPVLQQNVWQFAAPLIGVPEPLPHT